MVNKNNPQMIDDLMNSISMQMEIEFELSGKLYLLEPIYDDDGVNAIGWSLSTDNGNVEKRINTTDPNKVLNIEVNKVPLKNQLQKINLFSY